VVGVSAFLSRLLKFGERAPQDASDGANMVYVFDPRTPQDTQQMYGEPTLVPDGRQLALAVFATDSTADQATREKGNRAHRRSHL
jgi:hypothetical protein